MARKKTIEDAFDTMKRATEKASDPNMLVKNNPLADSAQDARATALFDANMDRLRHDAQIRRNPTNGHVYEALMGIRYEGGK